MKTVADVLGISRSHLSEHCRKESPGRVSGRPAHPDAALLEAIHAILAQMPTYGYRRVHAILRRHALAVGQSPPNHKRIYRIMKQHRLLLQRHAVGTPRGHDGRVATEQSNRRWCSDGMELTCENAQKVRIAFALDCCDREVMSYVATTSGIRSVDVQDMMLAAIEHRFGPVERSPEVIEWLTDNGSCYIAAETKRFARTLGLEPRTTPLRSPQSNGMAESFVRTLKRDYARVSPLPDAATVIAALPIWVHHYNTVHPHKALGYRSPREFISSHQPGRTVSGN